MAVFSFSDRQLGGRGGVVDYCIHLDMTPLQPKSLTFTGGRSALTTGLLGVEIQNLQTNLRIVTLIVDPEMRMDVFVSLVMLFFVEEVLQNFDVIGRGYFVCFAVSSHFHLQCFVRHRRNLFI